MKRKNGKIKSVGVQPCQSAWRSGPYTARHVPGLLTRTIAATVIPRKTSSDSSRRSGSLSWATSRMDALSDRLCSWEPPSDPLGVAGGRQPLDEAVEHDVEGDGRGQPHEQAPG